MTFLPPSTSPAPASPTSESRPERREWLRFPAGPEITCRVLPGPGADGPAPVRVRNISARGLCLTLDRLVKPGTVLNLELRHTARPFRCEVPLRVVYATWRPGGCVIAGGSFTRHLTDEELRGLTPTNPHGLEVEQLRGVTVAQFPSYSLWDEGAVRAVAEQLNELAEQGGNGSFVLDFRRVRGLNSSMLTQLLAFQHKVKAAGGRLALCAVAPDVQDVLACSRLDAIFPVFSSEQEAALALA